jgi:hypothetical protein
MLKILDSGQSKHPGVKQSVTLRLKPITILFKKEHEIGGVK